MALLVDAHRATTRIAQVAYPFLAEGGLGAEGTYIGSDVFSGGSFVYDPWVLYQNRVITNPNVLLAGVIGSGKSSTAKALITRSVALGYKAYIPCDPKGEWTVVTEAMGGTAIKLGPGLPARLNPLEAGHRPEAVPSDEWERMVWSRRRALLGTLAESTLGHPLAAIEHTALDIALETVCAQVPAPTIPDVVVALFTPDSRRADSAGLRATGLANDGREVAHAIRRLVHGDLSGMFDGPSTAEFDPTAPMISLDSSWIGGGGNDHALRLTLACASSWLEAAVADPAGGNRYIVYDEGWRVMRDPALLRRMQEQWKLSRAWGISNILIVHRLSDLAAVGDLGSEARALAEGLLADCSTRIMLRQESDQLARTASLLGLTDVEIDDRQAAEGPGTLASAEPVVRRPVGPACPRGGALRYRRADVAMRHARNSGPLDTSDMVIAGAAVLLGSAGMLHLAGGLGCLLITGRWVETPWIDSLGVLLHPGAPASAFGLERHELPPATYWIVLGLLIALPLVCGTLVGQFIRRRRAGAASRGRALAGRPGLATKADVEATVGRRQVVRRGHSARPLAPSSSPAEVGNMLGHSRGSECWASVEDSVIVVGPPRSGKGLHQIIGAIIDAPGAVVTTSTRPDNLAATLGQRREIGPVAIFDPQELSNAEGMRWSPVRGCENPTTAMVRASGLAAGAGFTKGGVSDGAFWHGQTEMALRGLLHAAAIDDTGIAQLYRWGLEPASAIEAVTILNQSSLAAEGWGDTLDGIVRMESRTRDAIWAGVRSALSALADPAVRKAFDPPPGEGLDPKTFIQEKGTIYLLGTGAGASATSAFIAALLEDITESARQLASRNPGGRLEPPLALVLDEIANLCAVPSLPGLMADGGGSGISTLVVIQSLAQARDRWGEQAAAAMWDAATLRLILGGSAQPRDLQDLAAVCGERDEEIRNWSRGADGGRTISTSTRRLPILPADVIRTLPFGTGVLLARTAPPILLKMTPWPNRPDAEQIRRSIFETS